MAGGLESLVFERFEIEVAWYDTIRGRSDPSFLC
jgi:hypothetical protein